MEAGDAGCNPVNHAVGHKLHLANLAQKGRVTRHVPTQTPPRGGRDASLRSASAPIRAALVMQGYPQR